MNVSYFRLTHHALDVHQQWPKNEQRDRATAICAKWSITYKWEMGSGSVDSPGG